MFAGKSSVGRGNINSDVLLGNTKLRDMALAMYDQNMTLEARGRYVDIPGFCTESFTSLLLVFVSIFWIVHMKLNRSLKDTEKEDPQLPPALPSLPLVGSLPFLVGHKNIAEFFMHTSKRLGPVFSFFAGSRNVVVLNGYEAIREALVTKGGDFSDRLSYNTVSASNPNKTGVALRPYGKIFTDEKKLILNILKEFGFGKRMMETRIQREVQQLIDYFRDTVAGNPVNPVDAVSASIGNVMLSILYGCRFDMNDKKMKEMRECSLSALQNSLPELDMFPILRYLPQYRQRSLIGREAFQKIIDFSDQLLTDFMQTEPKPESFVKSFVEIKGDEFVKNNLVHILRDLTKAGMDASTMTLLWTIVVMANHRSVQERVQAEIDSVVGRDRLPCLDDRGRMPYVEATMLEIMRYKFVAPVAPLRKTTCDTHVNGFFIPSQTVVLMNLFSTSMDPDTWKEPEKFIPERFLDDTGHVTQMKDKFIPFSLGNLACPGKQLARQEAFLFLSGLLQNFDIYPPEGCHHIDPTIIRKNFECVAMINPFLDAFDVRLVPRV